MPHELSQALMGEDDPCPITLETEMHISGNSHAPSPEWSYPLFLCLTTSSQASDIWILLKVAVLQKGNCKRR